VGGANGFARSAAEYGRRFAQRWYILLPGLVGAIALVASLAGVHLKLPAWVPWAVIGGSFFAANLWAFHDVRVERDSSAVPKDAKRRIEDELGTIINEGEWLADEYSYAPQSSEEQFGRWAADWWNRTGDFVETVLGIGERHVISAPMSAPNRWELIQRHCNLLRGVIERLSQADIRVNDEELSLAVEARRVLPDDPRDAGYLTPLPEG
jgi:hypothetical protein